MSIIAHDCCSGTDIEIIISTNAYEKIVHTAENVS